MLLQNIHLAAHRCYTFLVLHRRLTRFGIGDVKPSFVAIFCRQLDSYRNWIVIIEIGSLFMLAHGELIASSPPKFGAVSFVVPAHNEAKFIGPTIKAIKKAAKSVEVDFEIVVVNDASTDNTADIARELDTRVVDVDLRIIGAVRNAGARHAVNQWIIFVDADTIVPAKTLAQTVKALANGHAGGGARVVIDETQPLFWVKRLMYLGVVVVWQIIGRWAAGCYMYCRKDVFDSFGGFDETYYAAEELFFSRSVKQRGSFHIVRHPVVTSARKLHRYSTWELIRFLWVPLTNFGGLLKSKRGLEILYEDQR